MEGGREGEGGNGVIKELAHESAYRTFSPPGQTALRSRNTR